jgi:peptidyl-prolyl cis-trans isomerase A (cyclophilin A)
MYADSRGIIEAGGQAICPTLNMDSYGLMAKPYQFGGRTTMLKLALKVALGVFALLAQSSVAAPPQEPKPVRVVLETDAGNITVEVDTVHAPMTSANFLKYVDAGLYDGKSSFYRTVRPEDETNKGNPINVIDGDIDRDHAQDKFPPIPLERTSVTGLHHVTGTVSMGREKATDSAQSEIFICLADTPSLDFGGTRNADGQGFAAFGKVVDGMDVVKKIWQMPVQPGKQRLVTAVRIIKAHRE